MDRAPADPAETLRLSLRGTPFPDESPTLGAPGQGGQWIGQSDAVVDGGQTDRQLRGVGVFDRVAEYFLCAVVEQGGGGCRYRYAVVGRLPSDGGSSPAKRRCQLVDASRLRVPCQRQELRLCTARVQVCGRNRQARPNRHIFCAAWSGLPGHPCFLGQETQGSAVQHRSVIAGGSRAADEPALKGVRRLSPS